ncbi:Osmotin, thaumatin-like protein [Backusella circina FSU 941]|nr:Osmotin, thaumatin-like protein [Backusella circina FSU 941]
MFVLRHLLTLSLLPLFTIADKYIKVHNNCSITLSVGILTNGAHADTKVLVNVEPSKYHQFNKQDQWGGRVWARDGCSGSNMNERDCQIPGASNPATLAEFFFKGVYGKDFYDISLVDGYNLPMRIYPVKGVPNGYDCGHIACQINTCPQSNAVKSLVTGHVISCQSSCSASNAPEDCCTGSYDHPEVCFGGELSIKAKSQCPDAYTYAYDDATSTFACASDGYVVTFCY